jgi:hypothetical protein
VYTPRQIDRFWSNVDTGTAAECWPWKLSKHNNGYGQVALVIDGKHRILKAHKVAWEIHNDARLSPGVRSSHTCGNAICCNPAHVIVLPGHILGADIPRGERHGMSKLTERQVRLIKHKLNSLTTREISDSFRVSYQSIWDIRKGITWRHI